jgi:hypothetical protein
MTSSSSQTDRDLTIKVRMGQRRVATRLDAERASQPIPKETTN